MAETPPPAFSPDDQKRIIAALNEKAKLPCPQCGHPSFQLIDGFVNLNLSRDVAKIDLGGRVVPSIATACDRCGFIALYSAFVLGVASRPPVKTEAAR